MAEHELDDLYRVKPDGFTALRTTLATAANRRGDAAAARRIAAMRKPTTAAWVVNRLALTNATVPRRLADLARRLRDAHAAMDGDRIRELSAEQRRLVDSLARAAFQAADLADPSAALREDVTATLQAAIADPDVLAELGRLDKAQRYSGFGGFEAVPRKPVPRKLAPTKPAPTKPAPTKPASRKPALAKAELAEAQRAKAAADEALSQRRSELAAARSRRDEALHALNARERELTVADEKYHQAERASRAAAQALASLRGKRPN